MSPSIMVCHGLGEASASPYAVKLENGVIMRNFNLNKFTVVSPPVTWKKVTELKGGINNTQFKKLLQAADTDTFLEGIVSKKILEDAIVFIIDDVLVGLNIPRVSRVIGRNKIFRVGPIFVYPEHRGKSIASTYLKSGFAGKMAEAYIEPSNEKSRACFTKAGFTTDNKIVYLNKESFLHFKNF